MRCGAIERYIIAARLKPGKAQDARCVYVWNAETPAS
jgi:hypothetical protein